MAVRDALASLLCFPAPLVSAGNWSDVACTCTCVAEFLDNQPGEHSEMCQLQACSRLRGRCANLRAAACQQVQRHCSIIRESTAAVPPASAPLPAGFCLDPETKACTVPKVWSNADRSFSCPGELVLGLLSGASA